MDIVIHGTKGGRKIFTPNKLAGLLDVNSDSPKATAIGQKAYAIRFTEDNIIFSQYKIIRDVRGDKRTGFVGFSLFIQKNKKLKGSEIVTLLDSVSDEYCQRYIADNNLSEVTENWGFLDIILSEYKTTPQLNEENFQSGVKDDAFIYFNGSEELKSFFDTPYQAEYQPFRQILFVNKELENKPENPLNALRNSGIDLTGKIDLENPKYKLIFNSNASNGVRITVKANGTTISNNNKFRRKNELEISWIKQYYRTEIQRGKCFELADKFINIDKDAEKVTIKEIELLPEEKSITFEIKDSLGNLINDAEILICNSLDNKFKPQEWKKIDSANVVTPFIGENLGKSWTVTARSGKNQISEPHRIDFEKDCVGNVELFLNEIKTVEIKAFDDVNGDIINDFEIWWQLSNGYKRTNKIEFKNDEIYKKWEITITHIDYKPQNIYFLPSEKDFIEIKLSKKRIAQQANYGAIGGNIVENKYENNKKYPFFKKPPFIAGIILLILFVGAGLMFILQKPEETNTKSNISSYEIENYLKGNELLSNKLTEYRSNWENHLIELSRNQQVSLENNNLKWYNPLTWFNNDEQSMKSEDNIHNDTILQKIDSVMVLRDSIDKLNFYYLKKQGYSEEQKKFKESIENIKREDYEIIKDRLRYLAGYTLDQIADSINTILDSKQTKKDASVSQNASKENPVVPPKAKQQSISQSKNKKETLTPVSKNQTDEIKNYLNGNELKLSRLEDFLNKDNRYNKSIKLCIDFWDKVKYGTQKEEFDEILKKIKKDSNLNNSTLRDFLNSICASSDSFDKFKKMTGKAQLNTILKLKNKYESL